MPRTLGQKRENKITYMNVFQFFPKTAVQRRQHVDVVGCRTFFLAGWSACLSLIFCKFLVRAARFIVGAVHPIAPPWIWAWLQQLDVTSNFRIAAMFVFIKLQTKFHTSVCSYVYHLCISITNFTYQTPMMHSMFSSSRHPNKMFARQICCYFTF